MIKVINIPNYQEVVTELRAYTMAHLPSNDDVYNLANLHQLLRACPLIDTWLKLHNIIPRACAIIIAQPGAGRNGIHTDTQKNNLALNFGIFNAVDTYTALFKTIDGTSLQKTQANGITWDSYANAEMEEISRFNLEEPILFDTKIPHAVNNPTDKIRISISFRFFTDPVHLLD